MSLFWSKTASSNPGQVTRGGRIRLGTLFLALLCGSNGLAIGQTNAEISNEKRIRVLLVDGQNNHAIWPKTSEMMRRYLLDTGLFEVDLARTVPQGPDENFGPKFADFQVVVSNYNGHDWPEQTRKDFETYIKSGGGLVVIHAADNAFPEWSEWNRMIGLGGWGGRDSRSGPYVFYDERSQLQIDKGDGNGGSHGPEHEFEIAIRELDHPIVRDMPTRWLHAQDELYDRLRGPAEGMTVLATAFSSPEKSGTGRHEPMAMVVDYGSGRVFHTTLGHADYSQECVGFITLFVRGTEWAATGEVTFPLPKDFPTASATSTRKYAQDVDDN